MDKTDNFNDPLGDIDPVMRDAFSTTPPANQYEAAPEFDEDDDLFKDGEIADIDFPEINTQTQGNKVPNDVFSSIPVNLTVELGRTKISLKEVFELSEGSIIELERLVGEPLDLVVNGQVIAQGEVVAIDNNYGLRVTNIISKPNQ